MLRMIGELHGQFRLAFINLHIFLPDLICFPSPYLSSLVTAFEVLT